MLNEPNKQWLVLTPIALLVLAALLRLFFISSIPDRVVWSDEQKNLLLAENFSNGKGYVLANGKPTAIIPVGYPIFLAILRWVGLKTLWHIRLLQAFISTATVGLIGLLAHRIFGRKTALLAMLIGAVYPYFIFLPGTILATCIYCFFIVAGVWLFNLAITSNNYSMMFLSGMMWGVATLTVSTGMVLVLVLIVWQASNSRGNWRRYFGFVALLLAGFSLVTLPWLIRNSKQVGVVNLASNGGYNLWLGNNPGANTANPSTVPTPDGLQQRLIQAGSEAAQDSIFVQEAVRFIQAQPFAFVKRTLLKALKFWRLDPSPVTASYLSSSRLMTIVSWICFAPVLFFAYYGLHRSKEAERAWLKLWLWMAIVTTLVHALMIVKVRFRLPIDQFMIIAASFGAVKIGEQVIKIAAKIFNTKSWISMI